MDCSIGTLAASALNATEPDARSPSSEQLMARIILGSYFVRYPVGGNLSWVLQYLLGFRMLGHDVYVVEKSGYVHSCFDPDRNEMTDDCSYGARAVHGLLSRFDLGDRWCYIDATGAYHGLGRERLLKLLGSCDLFIEMAHTHEAWHEESAQAKVRIVIDADPGFGQIWFAERRDEGILSPAFDYDAYFTMGRNVGTPSSSSPTGGLHWRPLFPPVATALWASSQPADGSLFTTVMNWRSYADAEYGGKTYGHKALEFEAFASLPRRTATPLEIAVSGRDVPRARLERLGWRLRDGRLATRTFDDYVAYIQSSKGEFTVCKNGFVAMATGWFSERSALYLANGRPVVMQDTGFSSHLPCGRGLFAVRDVDEAAEAIARIDADYDEHARGAREIAEEFLSATKVLRALLAELGIG